MTETTRMSARALLEHGRQEMLEYDAESDASGRVWDQLRIDLDAKMRTIARWLEDPSGVEQWLADEDLVDDDAG